MIIILTDDNGISQEFATDATPRRPRGPADHHSVPRRAKIPLFVNTITPPNRASMLCYSPLPLHKPVNLWTSGHYGI